MKRLHLPSLFILLFLSHFGYSQDIPNASFENWSGGEPVDWHSTNQNILGFQFNVVNKETSSPQSGLSSARLEVVTKNIIFVGPVTVPGVLTLSDITIDVFQGTFNLSGGYPFTAMPQQLTGYMKYQPVGTDTCYYGFALSKWQNGTRDTIAYASDTITGNISSWTQFSLPIAYNIWEAPDTLSILFLCTNVNDPVVHTGTKLWIDNLSFIYGTVGIEGITFGDDYRIYADADSRQLIIESSFEKPKSIELSLFNMNGQCMIRKKAVMGMGKEFLDTNMLSKGTYILRMTEGKKIIDSRKVTLL